MMHKEEKDERSVATGGAIRSAAGEMRILRLKS